MLVLALQEPPLGRGGALPSWGSELWKGAVAGTSEVAHWGYFWNQPGEWTKCPVRSKMSLLTMIGIASKRACTSESLPLPSSLLSYRQNLKLADKGAIQFAGWILLGRVEKSALPLRDQHSLQWPIRSSPYLLSQPDPLHSPQKWKSLSCVWLFATSWTTVHGILQARILEWVAFPFSRGSSWSSNWTGVSYTAGGFFTNWAIREAPSILPMIYSIPTTLGFFFFPKTTKADPQFWRFAFTIPSTCKYLLPWGLLIQGTT